MEMDVDKYCSSPFSAFYDLHPTKRTTKLEKVEVTSSLAQFPFLSSKIILKMGCLRQVLLQTGLTFMSNMNSLDDPINWLNGRLDNATHTLLPSSLNHPVAMNNSLTVEMLGVLLPGLRDFRVLQVGDGLFIDEEKRSVVIHAKGNGMTDVGEYSNEYIFTLFATEDGKKVRESWELVDSFLAKEFHKKLNLTSV